ncbi:MAG: hypothetical protein A3J93_05460 [Candidatus Magasanikbacteria bacterium RIFOXYC2_FULL_42_28]|uniref:Uncharacterized protein n=1 Tax=Candidatus Magasanikbacteria bacterium RIFOXYC2_FULL_42_28 TaxID=1798704 RepID=A0A1F6NWI1_9BACT|nr:MAG: hypothetical protein A3J93_05460 [Candidatus Magasanikbacteria bacterium RIFOXYC2_FULL_42_28]
MNSKLKKLLVYVGTILIIFLGLNFKLFFGYLDYFSESNRNVTKCIKENQNKNIVGIEYSCAINEASKIYVRYPDKALRLCLKYSPVSASPFGKAICKSALEKK